MKKIILCFALIIIMSYANGQKPETGSVTAEVQLNFQTGTSAISISSPNLRGRYFFKNDLAGRLTFGYSSSEETINFDEIPDGSGATGKQETTSSKFTFGLGIEKHFKGTDKLSPYIGAELLSTSGTTGEISRSNTDGTIYIPDFIQNIIPGTTSTFGVNLLIGTDYYFVNSVYLGIEVAWGYQSSNTGEGTNTIIAGTTTTIVTPESSSHNFGVSTNAGLRLGYKF